MEGISARVAGVPSKACCDRVSVGVSVTDLFIHGIKGRPFSNLSHVYVVPYSDHSSYTELVEFVTAMKPKYIKPIIEKPGYLYGSSLDYRSDMSCFDTLLSDPSCPDQSLTPSVQEEASSLLINQNINCDQNSRHSRFANDCSSSNRKRVFKNDNPPSPEESIVSSTLKIPENPIERKLASLLRPLHVRKTRTRLKKMPTKRKKARSKIKSKGVFYTEEDLASLDESCSVDDGIVPQSHLLSQKVEYQKTVSNNCLNPKQKSNTDSAIIVIDSDEDDGENSSGACKDKEKNIVPISCIFSQLKKGSLNAATSICLGARENKNSEKTVFLTDDDGKDGVSWTDEVERDEKKSEKVKMCDVIMDPDFSKQDTVHTSEVLEEKVDLRTLQSSLCQGVFDPSLCSFAIKSKVSPHMSNIKSVYENDCESQETHNLQSKNCDVPFAVVDSGISQTNSRFDATKSHGSAETFSVLEASQATGRALLEKEFNNTNQPKSLNANTCNGMENGHILPGTEIAVNFWKAKDAHSTYFHFLTNAQVYNIIGLSSSWTKNIYCSEITALILEKHHGISKHLLKILPLCEEITVTSESEPFTVTAFDANHCPGSIMLYFDGNFGRIFYSGDFRSSAGLIANCSLFVKGADILYLDNTFCDEKFNFPSRSECFSQILDIIHHHPKSKIIIGVDKLGSETMLGELGLALNENIVVSQPFYKICSLLFNSNVFITPHDIKQSRIWAVPVRLQSKTVRNLVTLDNKAIYILPTAVRTGLDSASANLYVVPYSDHSSYSELQEFVSAVRPRCIKPILTTGAYVYGLDLNHRKDMACFDSLLSNVTSHEQSLYNINNVEAQDAQINVGPKAHLSSNCYVDNNNDSNSKSPFVSCKIKCDESFHDRLNNVQNIPCSSILHHENENKDINIVKRNDSPKKIKSTNILVVTGGDEIKPGRVKEEPPFLASVGYDDSAGCQIDLRNRKMAVKIPKTNCSLEEAKSCGFKSYGVVLGDFSSNSSANAQTISTRSERNLYDKFTTVSFNSRINKTHVDQANCHASNNLIRSVTMSTDVVKNDNEPDGQDFSRPFHQILSESCDSEFQSDSFCQKRSFRQLLNKEQQTFSEALHAFLSKGSTKRKSTFPQFFD
ncbi:5' exonuclease Apollo [Elysia marginata]|uniref:5' exonuclease Apollo n=1 Tax=Elysia marginata TaxID=1093978 RepID=A0AAV4ENK4_9GAST|nr:5' exonuclease Apollo [Elysia marginata]